MKRLYEIVIPDKSNHGIYWLEDKWSQWDKTVIDLAGGVTAICGSGAWLNPSTEEVQIEGVTTFKIACHPEQMEMLATYAKNFFEQEEIMYWELADKVFTV